MFCAAFFLAALWKGSTRTSKTVCSIYPSSVVEHCQFFCSVYPSSIEEGQHMYRHEEDGLTPGQLKNKYCTHSDRTLKGQLR